MQEHDALPTLKALQALTEDKLEVVDPSTGELAIVEPKKVRAIGLVDFPARSEHTNYCVVNIIMYTVVFYPIQWPISMRTH